MYWFVHWRRLQYILSRIIVCLTQSIWWKRAWIVQGRIAMPWIVMLVQKLIVPRAAVFKSPANTKQENIWLHWRRSRGKNKSKSFGRNRKPDFYQRWILQNEPMCGNLRADKGRILLFLSYMNCGSKCIPHSSIAIMNSMNTSEYFKNTTSSKLFKLLFNLFT